MSAIPAYSLEQLIDEFQDKVLNTALSYLQNAEDAEETAQDVFLEVHRSLQKFEGKSSVSTWIYRITVNKCIDRLRQRKRKRQMAWLTGMFQGREEHTQAADFDHPGVLLEKKESARMLFSAIDKLPENQKTAFLLSQAEQLTQKEIAAIMGLSEKAVESLIQRAKARLRQLLEKVYEGRRNSVDPPSK